MAGDMSVSRDNDIRDGSSGRCEAVERLYEAFGRYPSRPDMPTCEHCMPRKEIEHFCAKPLRALGASELYQYAWHAIGTVGEVVDFKHFLPRIFETMLWHDGGIDVEILTGKLVGAHWQNWAERERAAVSAFLAAWWRHVLGHYPSEQEPESCLCAIALAEGSIERFLDEWRGREDAAAVQHLAETLSRNYGYLMRDERLGRPWWEERPAEMERLRQWLIAPATGEALNRAFFRFAEELFAKQLSDAAQQFEWVREALRAREG